MPRRWIGLRRTPDKPKLTREASTSMEDLVFSTHLSNAPGTVRRPQSMCVPEMHSYTRNSVDVDQRYLKYVPRPGNFYDKCENNFNKPSDDEVEENHYSTPFDAFAAPENVSPTKLNIEQRHCSLSKDRHRRVRMRRNPVQRAASRLYRAGPDRSGDDSKQRDCVGPEFVVRASLPNKKFALLDCKGNTRKIVTVILLNGQKVDVTCNPNTTTAGQLFELIIQKEHIEDNFMLGLSALIAGDFVFLPSDTRISKAVLPGTSQDIVLTLFMRVRFFLPSLRGMRNTKGRHLLYLQLRRSILEHQLPCSFTQLVELDGLALQAEFGDYDEKEHGTRDYFLLEHYIPETMACIIEDSQQLRYELIRAHKFKKGMDSDKAEEDFIVLAQTLPHYGGHFYTSVWIFKDNTQKDVWLYISAQGINIYERGNSTTCGPMLYEMFEWRTIQTLCYSKHYLCILPHTAKLHGSKMKKYKLKMDHKKSYFTFRLASLHHQFFLRLRTQFTSLQSLSQQFGIALKDMKNETNSLYKLEALTNAYLTLDKATVNAETEFKIEFRSSTRSKQCDEKNITRRRSKSVNDFTSMYQNESVNEECQNKENENPLTQVRHTGLTLDSSCLSGLPIPSSYDKRRGVKMGVRAFGNIEQRVSRSMEAVNMFGNDELEQLSLQSVSIHCGSVSTPQSPIGDSGVCNDAYVIGSSIKSDAQFLPDFQESLSESLMNKLNNFSFAEERILQTVVVEKDSKGSLGIQITEGSDGKVYIQSVIPGGPAHSTGCVNIGDQIVAVNGQNLLTLKYNDALQLLKITGRKVEFLLSQDNHLKSQTNCDLNARKLRIDSNVNESHSALTKLEKTMNRLKRISYPGVLNTNYLTNINGDSKLEKHITESCFDISNLDKYLSNYKVDNPIEVPYHKHIRYEIEPEMNLLVHYNVSPHSSSKNSPLSKNISKSCTQIFVDEKNDNDKAVIVDMIPKTVFKLGDFQSLDRKILRHVTKERCNNYGKIIPPIALPRSLGLSRKWRGPVKYPVTPVKSTPDEADESSVYITTSDDEQVFI